MGEMDVVVDALCSDPLGVSMGPHCVGLGCPTRDTTPLIRQMNHFFTAQLVDQIEHIQFWPDHNATVMVHRCGFSFWKMWRILYFENVFWSGCPVKSLCLDSHDSSCASSDSFWRPMVCVMSWPPAPKTQQTLMLYSTQYVGYSCMIADG